MWSTMREVASRKRGRPLGSTKKRKVKDKKGRFVKEAPARVETYHYGERLPMPLPWPATDA